MSEEKELDAETKRRIKMAALFMWAPGWEPIEFIRPDDYPMLNYGPFHLPEEKDSEDNE